MKVLSLLLISYSSSAFILIDPDYRLSDAEKVTVNIASGACRSNGMSDEELRGAISLAIRKYWNTVSESRLRLKLGEEVSTPITGQAGAGEILVGCQNIGASASGVTNPNASKNGAKISLNSTMFVPGGYYPDGLTGVLSHEMGHALGLAHSADAASVMTYESHDWGPAANYLSQDDKLGVTYLYPRKGVAGGILGGCTSDARTLDQKNEFSWPAFVELFVLLFIGQLLSTAGKTVSRLRAK